MKEKTIGIIITSMWLMLDRIGEDQVVVGLGLGCFSKKKSRRKNPATVRRTKVAGLGAGLKFLYMFGAIKAAGFWLT